MTCPSFVFNESSDEIRIQGGRSCNSKMDGTHLRTSGSQATCILDIVCDGRFQVHSSTATPSLK